MYQDFWARFDLREEHREICERAVRNRYNGHEVEEFVEQGYCSWTLLLVRLGGTENNTNEEENLYEEDQDNEGIRQIIVQLRPASHALDLGITRSASETYPSLAPTIEPLDLRLPGGLLAYAMGRLPGTSLRRLLPRTRILTSEAQAKVERLVVSFAGLIAQGWLSACEAQSSSSVRGARADSPLANASDMLSQCRGKVGSTIVHRLEKLAAELPGAWLRGIAETMLSDVPRIADYPVLLNHGDLIPSNILVDEDTWEITGLVDWAEAELLPFGTCLYGLEHLLGYFTPASLYKAPTWTYFEEAAQLRNSFWLRLFETVPELRVQAWEMRVMRTVGVLLWHGIAWDDGAIDRVVNELDDQEELVKLRAFLGSDGSEAGSCVGGKMLSIQETKMVSTRRSNANAVHPIVSIRTPRVPQPINDTIRVLNPRGKKTDKGKETLANPDIPSGVALSENISEHDLSLTSPITDENLNDATTEPPQTKTSSPNLPSRIASSASQRQASKPIFSMSGSCHNPIVLNEGSSPPRPRMRPPKRKHRNLGLLEPHKFMDNGYKELYNYGVSRSTSSAMPANGGTFTGHRSHDIYRMMNAKMTMVPDFSMNVAGGRSTISGSFGTPHPHSVEILAQQYTRPSFPSPHVQYYQYQATPVQYLATRPQSEDMLRAKAAQYIHDLPSFSSHKRRISSTDPAEAGGDEAEPAITHIDLSRSFSNPKSGVAPPSTPQTTVRISSNRVAYQSPQPNLDVRRLIEHTSLITCLLQIYPHSTDQKGLREDISMMASAQTQHIAEWMSSESQDLRKRMKVNRQDAVNADTEMRPSTALCNRVLDEKDRELRQAFSASADMWQDGTGHGVADVYATTPASSPGGRF
ncbi:hypothetical protein TW65_08739 [Stemphylium lycopersici]|nr:hypothetical protein TW65_08739 [Stemphylium lycopersici]